jgi:hypothetical protein
MLLFSAIQLHPTKAPLWIMAASWEFEENANIVAARGELHNIISAVSQWYLLNVCLA